MSKFGTRLLHDEAIGVDVSALLFTTKASSSETANNHFKTHANISLPKVSGNHRQPGHRTHATLQQ